jgi:hypothetical protein
VAPVGGDAAGLLLADRQERLQVVSTDQAHLTELFAVQALTGPCVYCYRAGHEVLVPDLGAPSVRQRWPKFVGRARELGFHAAYALPMRMRETTIGALTLFLKAPVALSRSDLRVGRALADIATIAIFQQRTTADQSDVADQLRHALSSRIIIEQAKARLAERHDIPVAEAFELMRNYARSHNLRVHDLAASISADTETHAVVVPGASARHSPSDNPRRGPLRDTPADQNGSATSNGTGPAG